MMMNLMTILVKKVFISSKPTFVYLLCPPLCGPFSIQESAAGGLSYKGTNRVTVSRLISELAREDFLRVINKRVELNSIHITD